MYYGYNVIDDATGASLTCAAVGIEAPQVCSNPNEQGTVENEGETMSVAPNGLTETNPAGAVLAFIIATSGSSIPTEVHIVYNWEIAVPPPA